MAGFSRNVVGDVGLISDGAIGAGRVEGLLDAVPQSIQQTDAQAATLGPENDQLAMKTMQDVRGYADFLRGLADDQRQVVWPHIVNKINMQDATFAKIANLDPANPPSKAELEAILLGTGKTDAIKSVLDSRTETEKAAAASQATMSGKMFDFQAGMAKQKDQQQADIDLKKMERDAQGIAAPSTEQARMAVLSSGIGNGIKNLFSLAEDPEPQTWDEKLKRTYEMVSLDTIEQMSPYTRTEYQHRLLSAYAPVKQDLTYYLSGAQAGIPETKNAVTKLPMPWDFKQPGIQNKNITLAEEKGAQLIEMLKIHKAAARTKAPPEKRQEVMEGLQAVIDSTQEQIANFRAKKDAEAGNKSQAQSTRPSADRVAGFIEHLRKDGKTDEEIQSILARVKK